MEFRVFWSSGEGSISPSETVPLSRVWDRSLHLLCMPTLKRTLRGS